MAVGLRWDRKINGIGARASFLPEVEQNPPPLRCDPNGAAAGGVD
jgi:hypothetical protein